MMKSLMNISSGRSEDQICHYSLHHDMRRFYGWLPIIPETNAIHFQNYVIFTNYQFYIDEFIKIAHQNHAGQ